MRHRVPFKVAAVIAILIGGSLIVSTYTRRRDDHRLIASENHATRTGRLVTLQPSNAHFEIPDQWVEWFNKFHNNLHLSRGELAAVEKGGGEWDSEYAAVVNSVLPFRDCLAHVGGEGWGETGTSFGDTQMRAYLTDAPAITVVDRVALQGLASARLVSTPDTSLKPEELNSRAEYLDEGKEGRWRRVMLQYPLWYGDYGGTARIRFYVTTAHDRTLVLVFMGGNKDEIDGIVNSVVLP